MTELYTDGVHYFTIDKCDVCKAHIRIRVRGTDPAKIKSRGTRPLVRQFHGLCDECKGRQA